MIKNWELKIKENKSTLIINDWGVKSDDIIDLARHLVIKFHFDRLYINYENTGKIIHCALKDNDPINKCLTMNCGMKASIIKYRSHNDIDIQFEDGTIIKHRDFRDFCKGKIANPNLSKRKSWEDVRITNIQWDASDDVMAGLPDKVNALDLNINLSQYDTNEDLNYNEDFLYGVSEALSEKYGFCHDGFELEISMGKMESKIVGIINQFGENDFSYWTGFCLNDEEQKQIEEILHRHDTEGCSIRGTKSDISNEIKEWEGNYHMMCMLLKQSINDSFLKLGGKQWLNKKMSG